MSVDPQFPYRITATLTDSDSTVERLAANDTERDEIVEELQAREEVVDVTVADNVHPDPEEPEDEE